MSVVIVSIYFIEVDVYYFVCNLFLSHFRAVNHSKPIFMPSEFQNREPPLPFGNPKSCPWYRYGYFLESPNMLSKLVREDEDFLPRKKANSGLGYAAEYRIQLKIWLSKIYVRDIYFYCYNFENSGAPNDDFPLHALKTL